jgi:glyoxylase-like metal-dependent hydrolase (beta-lactamase superfamily II)
MSISRRGSLKLLAAGAAAAGAGSPFAARPGASALAARPADEPFQGAGSYRFNLGTARVAVVSDGTFPIAPPHPTLGGNAPEADVRRAFADAFVPYDRVVGHVNVLMVRTSVDVVLVDTGCGPGFAPTTGKLLQHLALLGVEPRDVSAVILTHAHRDHVGGVLDEYGAPAFPHARYLVHRDELAFWAGGNPDLSRSGAPAEVKRATAATAARTFAALDKVLSPFADGEQLLAGVRVVAAPGHTPGHCALQVTSGAERLLYVTDAVHHAAINLPHPEWHVAYDADPAAAAESRRSLLARAAADGMLVSGSHLPFPALGHVRAAGKGFEWEPAVWEW